MRLCWICAVFLGSSLLAGCNVSPVEAPPATVTLPAMSLPASTPVPTVDLSQALTPSRTPGPVAVGPTLTPSLTPSPTLTPTLPEPPATEVAALLFNAQVAEERGGLRLRLEPNNDSQWLINLVEFAPLNVIGESADGLWLQVETAEGYTGWVWASYVIQDVDWSQAQPTAPAAVAAATAAAYFQANDAPPDVPAISGITGNARSIFLAGQARGNRANVFSKVGDSLTVATYTLYAFGWRTYSLGDYAYLYPALSHFSAPIARDGRDSFANESLAADNGWIAADVLDPANADPDVCQPGESPLVCEYRVVRPAVALVLFGTNDVGQVGGEAFAAAMAQITETSIEMGVVPVLTTIPNRAGYEDAVRAFNGIITETARRYDVPLLDYYLAMAPLPNQGLAEDGLHPSWPPGDYAAAAFLTAENLQYGYTQRNLTCLQVLDAVWRYALY